MNKRLSRRQFLIHTGAIAVGGVLVACAPQEPAGGTGAGSAQVAAEATAAPASE